MTIQNKVTPSEAALQDRLSREFERFPIKGPGYCSCATSAARAFPFTAVPSHQTCPPGISVGAINVWWLTLNAHVSIRPALREAVTQMRVVTATLNRYTRNGYN